MRSDKDKHNTREGVAEGYVIPLWALEYGVWDGQFFIFPILWWRKGLEERKPEVDLMTRSKLRLARTR